MRQAALQAIWVFQQALSNILPHQDGHMDILIRKIPVRRLFWPWRVAERIRDRLTLHFC
jgi:hypothetical protein